MDLTFLQPQDTIELVRRGGMSLTQVSFLLNGTPCDYDPAANGGDLPSSWSSDNSLSVCSIEPRVPVILEQDFIQAISRTFALPTTDLDCLRGIDADLYLNPLEALFQLGDETSCGHEDIRQFESFLEVSNAHHTFFHHRLIVSRWILTTKRKIATRTLSILPKLPSRQIKVSVPLPV